MKLISIFVLLAELASFDVLGQNNIFIHGQADGAAMLPFLQNSSGNMIFVHGQGDGFSNIVYNETKGKVTNNSIFGHNSGDGFSIANVPPVSNNILFAHGSGDGFDLDSWTITPISNSIFAHSSSDGFCLAFYNSSAALSKNNLIFSHGLSDGFAFVAVNINGVAIASIEEGIPEEIADQVIIFPNPTTGSVFIILPAYFEHGRYVAKIFDVAGHLVYAQPVLALSISMDLNGMGKGTYLLVISDATTSVKQRLVLY